MGYGLVEAEDLYKINITMRDIKPLMTNGSLLHGTGWKRWDNGKVD